MSNTLNRYGLNWDLTNPSHRASLAALDAGGIRGGNDGGGEGGGEGGSGDGGGSGGEGAGAGSAGAGDGGAAGGGDGGGEGGTGDGGTGTGGEGASRQSLLDGEGGAGSQAGGEGTGELTLTLPEGIQADSPVLKAFMPTFQEVGLSSEQASKMVEAYAQWEGEQVVAQAKRLDDQAGAWADELKADPDFGGEKFDASVDYAKRAYAQMAPGLAEELIRMGLDHWPPLFKFAARVGAGLREDNGRGSGGASPNDPKAKSEAELAEIFPDMYNADGSRKRQAG